MRKIIILLILLIFLTTYSKIANCNISNDTELLVAHYAHPPYGYKGFTNKFYYWYNGYGPAGSYGRPEFYDINTGKLQFKTKYDWYFMNVYGRYIIYKRALVPEYFDEYDYSYVYSGSKLLLKLKEGLLYIDDQRWYSVGNKEISIYSTQTNKKVDRYFLRQHEHPSVYFIKDKAYFLIGDSSSGATKVVDVENLNLCLWVPVNINDNYIKKGMFSKISKGVMYKIDMINLKVVSKTPTPLKDEIQIVSKNRAFDDETNTLVDISSGEQVLRVQGESFIEKVIGNNFICADYEGNNIRCYSLESGILLWQLKGLKFRLLFANGNILLGYSDFSGPTLCINAVTGKIMWSIKSLRFDYYYSHYRGNFAYVVDQILNESDKYSLYCVNLNTGKVIWEKNIGSSLISDIDFERNRYYIRNNDKINTCYSLISHIKIW